MPIQKINGEDIAWQKMPDGSLKIYKVELHEMANVPSEYVGAILKYELDPNTPKDPILIT
ncbi:MAG: hypothetical protein Ta2F_15100 [Termitinemataceae bacterium]|nr:MAG: hypothetical protein Ta2F_15100 [Termitinemataceae bacterium]